MAATYDNKNTATGGGASTLTILAFTVSGSNRLLFVTVGSSAAAAALTTSVVRDSGGLNESCTEAWDLTNGTYFHSSGHYLVAPATGSYAILITLAAAQDEIGACATSWTAAHQTVPIGTPVTDSAHNGVLNPTLTVSDAGDDDVVIDGVYVYDATIAAETPGQTEQANLVISAAVTHGCSTQLGSVAGDVMSWTGSASGNWAAGAVAIKPAAGGITVTQTSVISAAASVLTHAAATLYPGSVIPTITL